MQQCRAFRVACEFLPESRAFSLPKLHPWLLNFCEDGHAYYVCEFKRGEELLLSDMIRSTGIQQEMRPVTRRVAILAPGANRSLISECGIKFFCTVDDDWDLAVTEAAVSYTHLDVYKRQGENDPYTRKNRRCFCDMSGQ